MTAGKVFKRFGWGLLTIALMAVVTTLVALSSARVELTASGAHQRLLVPVVRGAIGIPIYAGTGEDVFMPGHLDGPIVRTTADGGSATWYCQDKVQSAKGFGPVLRVECAGRAQVFPVVAVPVPDAVDAMPEKLVVLSDLEGNARFLDAALRKLEVVDASGQWRYGQGHLVVLGDSVDRGRDVFAVLWRLHALAGQARAAGGAVHVVLGNHEQYILRGNISRADPDHRFALKQLGGYQQAFAADTVIGAWLREQPVILKLGRVLFTHGGISADVVDTGLSVTELNAAMRQYWDVTQRQTMDPRVLAAVSGRYGLTQYRGYFDSEDPDYPVATPDDIARLLAQFDADHIVVGHTLVERVTQRHDGRVIAVDVNDDAARPEVLVFSSGIPEVVDMGVSRGLDGEAETRTRAFSLLDASDRRLVAAMYRAFSALSRIPQFPNVDESAEAAGETW